ncbi:hypothetical protein NDU88_005057 [Pleurodeles waltl]|uniref:Uncharacterized protein n=1 Tax=Pleurodeles waltl TaxID=8319 RepID=A0AAV7SKK5_PLEWA|nr:hypothetical protein NDU88_005057 [Pleurodeles waltl]
MPPAVSASHHIRGQRCRVVPSGELAEWGAPGAVIWFDQIGASGEQILPHLLCFTSAPEMCREEDGAIGLILPRTHTAPDIVNLESGNLSASGVILVHGHGERLRLVWDVDPSRLDRAGPFSTLLLWLVST